MISACMYVHCKKSINIIIMHNNIVIHVASYL